jgi:hypothetical protein
MWMNVNVECKLLVNCHHDIEWTYRPAYGIKSMVTGDLIFQTRDMAYDVEYYYRGAEYIPVTPGQPDSVVFN